MYYYRNKTFFYKRVTILENKIKSVQFIQLLNLVEFETERCGVNKFKIIN